MFMLLLMHSPTQVIGPSDKLSVKVFQFDYSFFNGWQGLEKCQSLGFLALPSTFAKKVEDGGEQKGE